MFLILLDTKRYLGYVPLRTRPEGQSCQRLNWGFPRLLLKPGQTAARCRQGKALPRLSVILCLLMLSTILACAQESISDKPIPILSGSAGYFTNVTAGQNELDAQINPVLLVPLGDRWLFESRAEFEGQFQRPPGGGPYGGPVNKHLDYAQVDYIANPYLTITAGRFLTPFGIFNERLYPIWIRALQPDPLIFPIATASSDGAMLRGGFPVSNAANMNYAVYVSAASIGVSGVESERHAGARLGFFFPRPRLEVGGSFQKVLQDTRTNAFGFHMGWQPAKLPLNLRSEYARSVTGSGYWVEGAYRLSQLSFWQKPMRRTEVVARAQQFFIGDLSIDPNLPAANTREADFGINYFLRDGLKGVASYGRQFSSQANFNLWTFGIAYRFLVPLGRTGVE